MYVRTKHMQYIINKIYSYYIRLKCDYMYSLHTILFYGVLYLDTKSHRVDRIPYKVQLKFVFEKHFRLFIFLLQTEYFDVIIRTLKI